MPRNSRTPILLLLLCGLACGKEPNRYVRADVVNLRKKPDAASEMMFRLRINSPVREMQRKGDWSLVGFGPSLEGWVQADMLGVKPYSKQDIRDSLQASPDMAKWAGRLVAAFPEDEANWDLLYQAFQEKSDAKGMAMVQAHREGKEVAYLAQCSGGTLQLLGKLDTNEVFASYAWTGFGEGVDEPDPSIPRSKAVSATGQRWYSLAGPVPDTLFNALKKGPSAKWLQRMETARPSYGMYLEGFDTQPKWYEMGACSENQIYATRPIRKANRKVAGPGKFDTTGFWRAFLKQDSSLRRMDKDLFMLKPYPEVGLFEVITQYGFTGHYGETSGIYMGLRDAGGALRYPKQGDSHCVEYMQDEKKRFNDVQFFSFSGDKGNAVYGLYLWVSPAPEGGVIHLDLMKFDEAGNAVGFNIFKNYQGS